MKVQPSAKKICNKCQIIRRNGGVLTIVCKKTPRHKQRQG